MRLKLYVIPSSHPCATVEAALALKGLEYRRRDLLPLVSKLVGRVRYGRSTVPGLLVSDGPRGSEKIGGSREILRWLDETVPEPALLPDGELGTRLLEIETWGDEVLQSIVRRITDAVLVRRPRVMERYIADAHLGLPKPLLRPGLPLTARLMSATNHATDDAVRRDLVELPAQLERIDAWIAEGLLGGERPNAADLQLGGSLRLLRSFGDARELVDARPAGRLVAYFPPLGAEVEPGVLPPDWLPPGALATS